MPRTTNPTSSSTSSPSLPPSLPVPSHLVILLNFGGKVDKVPNSEKGTVRFLENLLELPTRFKWQLGNYSIFVIGICGSIGARGARSKEEQSTAAAAAFPSLAL